MYMYIHAVSLAFIRGPLASCTVLESCQRERERERERDRDRQRDRGSTCTYSTILLFEEKLIIHSTVHVHSFMHDIVHDDKREKTMYT